MEQWLTCAAARPAPGPAAAGRGGVGAPGAGHEALTFPVSPHDYTLSHRQYTLQCTMTHLTRHESDAPLSPIIYRIKRPFSYGRFRLPFANIAISSIISVILRRLSHTASLPTLYFSMTYRSMRTNNQSDTSRACVRLRAVTYAVCTAYVNRYTSHLRMLHDNYRCRVQISYDTHIYSPAPSRVVTRVPRGAWSGRSVVRRRSGSHKAAGL